MWLGYATKFQVFHLGPESGPLVSRKVRQINTFDDRAAFIFLLIIARPEAYFSTFRGDLYGAKEGESPGKAGHYLIHSKMLSNVAFRKETPCQS
jgi:hypothetical protein